MNSFVFRRLPALSLLAAVALSVTHCSPAKNGDPAPAAEPGRASWVELAPMHVPRTGTAAVSLADGTVLACAGMAVGSGTPAPTELYNPATNTWQQLPNSSLNVNSPSLLRLRNGDVLAYGGYVQGGTSSVVARYSAATRQWTTVGQLGFLAGQSYLNYLDAATELRDGRVVLAASNRIYILSGTSLRPFHSTSWGQGYYHGTSLVALPNGHFLAGWNTRPNGDALFVMREYDPDLSDAGYVRQLPLWLPTATFMSTALLNDSTLLAVSGYGNGNVTLAGTGPTVVNLRTGAYTRVPAPVTHNFMPTTMVRLSDGRLAVVTLGQKHNTSIFNPTTRQWQLNYGSLDDQALVAWWPASDKLNSSGYAGHSFATVLPGDDLFIAGQGVNWRLKKR